MVLIIGGAYQGKLRYAMDAFQIAEQEVFLCRGTEIDFSCRCIGGIDHFTLACVRAGVDPIAYFRDHREEWENSVLTCRDIFCGVVPMGAELRQWREVTGRLCQYLSGEAEQVSRLFCGLEQRLK